MLEVSRDLARAATPGLQIRSAVPDDPPRLLKVGCQVSFARRIPVMGTLDTVRSEADVPQTHWRLTAAENVSPQTCIGIEVIPVE